MSSEKSGGNLKGFYIVFAIVALVGLGAVAFNVGSKALGSAAMEPVDLEGIREDQRLLRDLAVNHPVSALLCRTVAVPGRGQILIPIVFEGTSALDVLGIG